MTEKADMINAVADFIEKVGNSKWRQVLTFGFFGIVLFTFYENRTQVWTTLINSPYLAGSLGMGCILLFIGWAISNLQQRIYDRYDREILDKANRIAQLELAAIRKEEHIERFRVEIAEQLKIIKIEIQGAKR